MNDAVLWNVDIDVSEERVSSVSNVERISELGKALPVITLFLAR
jgi:hypothetical protein